MTKINFPSPRKNGITETWMPLVSFTYSFKCRCLAWRILSVNSLGIGWFVWSWLKHFRWFGRCFGPNKTRAIFPLFAILRISGQIGFPYLECALFKPNLWIPIVVYSLRPVLRVYLHRPDTFVWHQITLIDSTQPTVLQEVLVKITITLFCIARIA